MLKPTNFRTLGFFALASIAVGWAVATVWFVVVGQGFPVPGMTALTLWVFAASLLGWTLMSRKTIKPVQGQRTLDPLVATRTAALAMAGSRMAAIVFGFYAGVLVWNFSRFDTPSGEERVFISVANIVAAVLITIISLWLENNCRLPEKDDENS